MFAYLRLRCLPTYVYDVCLLTSTMFAYLRVRCSSTYAYILRLRAVLDKVILTTLGWDDRHRLLESTVSRYLQWQGRPVLSLQRCTPGFGDDFVDILLAYMIHSQFKCLFHLFYYMNYNEYIPSWLLAMYLMQFAVFDGWALCKGHARPIQPDTGYTTNIM
jgi:hypothetical protein